MAPRSTLIGAILLAACGSTTPVQPAADAGMETSDLVVADSGATTDVMVLDDATDLPTTVSPGWHDRAALPDPQQEVAVVALDGLIWVMGGFNATAQQVATVVTYDPSTDVWAPRASFPTPANHINAVVHDGKIWVTGFLHMGFQPDGRSFIFDPDTDAWSPGPDLPAGRERGASAIGVIDGLIYVAGGIGSGGAVAQFDVLDPATGVWTALADVPRTVDHAGYGVIDGVLVVAAGRNGAISSFVDRVHRFDPVTGQWTEAAPIPTARGGVASAVFENRLYVFGGEGAADEPGRVFPQAEVYDFATDRWSELAPMTRPRHGFAGATLDGVIYLPGGAATEFLDAVATHQIYIP